MIKRQILAMVLAACMTFLGAFSPITSYAAVSTVPVPDQFKVKINTTYAEITWAPVPSGVTHTVIERSMDSGDFYGIATLSPGITLFKDSNISNGHVYRYRAKNIISSNSSASTSEAEIIYLYPTSLTFPNRYSDQIDINWTYPKLTVDRIINLKTIVERRVDGETSWSVVYSAPYPETECRDHGLKANTLYYYRIRTQYADGTYSEYYPYSTAYSTRTSLPLSTTLSGFAISNTEIRLEWDPTTLNGYMPNLQKMTDTGTWASFTNSNIYDHYNDSGLTTGKTYFYRIYLSSTSGMTSIYSDTIEINTETIPAPSNCAALPISDGRIAVTWDYPYSVESGFEVWRKEEGGIWAKLENLSKNNHAYTDNSAMPGSKYTYRVRAYRGSNVYSSFSTTSLVNNADPATPPVLQMARMDGFVMVGCDAAPVGIKYILETRTGINENWVDYYSVEGGPFITYIFPSQGLEMDLRLRSENKGNVSYGPVHHMFGTVPEAPESFNITALGSSRVVLSWKDATEKEDGYRLYRTIGGKRELAATVGKNSISCVDTGITPNTKVTFELVAYNTMGESKSVTIKAGIPIKPAFRDLGSVTWAQESINALCGMGAITQSPEKLFYPNYPITRAEFLTMLMKAFGVSPSNQYLFTLKDVPRNAWYYRFVMSAVQCGILTPDENGYVYPFQPLTKADLAAFFNLMQSYRGKSINTYSTDLLTKYTDAYLIDDSLKGVFASLCGDNILPPQGGSSLNVSAQVTRAEGASAVYKFWRVYP